MNIFQRLKAFLKVEPTEKFPSWNELLPPANLQMQEEQKKQDQPPAWPRPQMQAEYERIVRFLDVCNAEYPENLEELDEYSEEMLANLQTILEKSGNQRELGDYVMEVTTSMEVYYSNVNELYTIQIYQKSTKTLLCFVKLGQIPLFYRNHLWDKLNRRAAVAAKVTVLLNAFHAQQGLKSLDALLQKQGESQN